VIIFMNIKFIFFDIGGVLVNHLSGVKMIAKKLNINEEKTINFFDTHYNSLDKGLLSWAAFEKQFYNKFNPLKKLDKSLYEEFVLNFEIIKTNHSLIYDLVGKIDIGILSNITNEVFTNILKYKKIPNIEYKHIIKSCELGFIKPEKEIFEYAIKKTGLSPGEVLLIDDNVKNIDAAKKFGWNAILFHLSEAAKFTSLINKML